MANDVLVVLAAGVALVYFTIAAFVVPRISLPNASRRFELAVRGGAIGFFVGCGLTHIHIAVHAWSDPAGASAHELAFHALQFVGGWTFVLATIGFLDIEIQRKQTPDELRVRELERLALRDGLTGAYNRRFFDEALQNEVERHHRYGSPLAVVFFDVDDLKAMNDAGGHVTGDWVLKNVTAVARDVVRASDSVVRFGGDEFALVLPEADQLRASAVAERLRKAVARLTVPPGGRVSISAGVASIPEDALTAAEVVAVADRALYWAKKHGKNITATATEVVVVSEDAGGDRVSSRSAARGAAAPRDRSPRR
jgi:diguanylate cyclase (GGDEF)-like protein